jgi:hypothetical protein
MRMLEAVIPAYLPRGAVDITVTRICLEMMVLCKRLDFFDVGIIKALRDRKVWKTAVLTPYDGFEQMTIDMPLGWHFDGGSIPLAE